MDGGEVKRGVFYYDFTVDRKGTTYLRMFNAKEMTQPNKSLVIDPSTLLIEMQKGEAWIETKGGTVERIIPLAEPWLEGLVTKVTKDAVTVTFAKLRTDGTFPADWGPPVSMVRMKDTAYVHPRNRVIYVRPIHAGERGKVVDFTGANPQYPIIPQVRSATYSVASDSSAPDHHQSSQHYPSYDYRNHQAVTQPMQSQSYGNVHGSFPDKPQTIPSHPVQPHDAQWPPQGYSNPSGYGPPPQYPSDATRLSSAVPMQPAQHQGIPSAQDGGQARQDSRSTESNHFEITEEMRSNVHAPCREDFHNRTPEIPVTIGRHRLPIETLQGEFKWNELMVRKLQLLVEKYSSWRRCRGDGNCFYRCVGVLLCEHYCRPDTPIAEVGAICKAMIEQSLHFSLMSNSPEVLSNVKMWQRLLKDIYTTRTSGENAFQRLQYFLQKPKFDKAIIIAIRNYTAAFFQLHSNDSGVIEFLPEGPGPVIREIMEYGTEAEGIALKFAAQAFNIILHIFTVDNKSGQTSETTYGPAVRNWYPSMHLLHLPGHYNYLVPRAWDINDYYDFVSNTYNPVPTGTIFDYEEYVPPT